MADDRGVGDRGGEHDEQVERSREIARRPDRAARPDSGRSSILHGAHHGAQGQSGGSHRLGSRQPYSSDVISTGVQLRALATNTTKNRVRLPDAWTPWLQVTLLKIIAQLSISEILDCTDGSKFWAHGLRIVDISHTFAWDTNGRRVDMRVVRVLVVCKVG
eukprot:1549468-Pleurochrysis_carterae.AAC.3